MKSINLVLGVHNHQPVGNFEHIFETAYEKSYGAFLDVLERHPTVRFAFHNTGPLTDWLLQHHPEYIDRLREIAGRGQIEFLSGGYYEPILPVIPDHDKIGQMRLMNERIEGQFGVRPRGMWLAERVWEPQLPRPMREAGLEFAALDDSHFKCAGLNEDETYGYYLTEEAGHAVAVFPINEKLRYIIPFHEPEETIEYLDSLATEDGDRLIVMIDDGEKFGIWPGTHKHCYQDGWLKRFFAALEENASWLRLMHFSDALDNLKPLGRVYLPTASYIEMMEWALPAGAIERYEDFVHSLKDRPDIENEQIFIRGGFWRNFLAKYDEGNHMHKRMIRVSEKVQAALERRPHEKKLQEARTALWRGQCNCAYWHGVFGGLYLPHLRSAVYRCLIEADAIVDRVTRKTEDWIDIDKVDFDCDGHDELIVETPLHALFFKPSAGGALVEHDHVAKRFNLIDVFGRRREGYHRRVVELADQEEDGEESETASIHDHISAKEEGLERLLNYDWHRRGCFLDHFVSPETTLQEFAESRQREFGDFANQPYTVQCERRDTGVRITLERDGSLFRPEGVCPVQVTKELAIPSDRVEVDGGYRITNQGDQPVQIRFGVEFCFNFLAGDAYDRHYFIDGKKPVPARLVSTKAHSEVHRIAIVDEWLGLEVRVTPDKAMELWRFPIETVSVSEGGFERIYQGSVLFAHCLLDLEPGKTELLGFRYQVLDYPAD